MKVTLIAVFISLVLLISACFGITEGVHDLENNNDIIESYQFVKACRSNEKFYFVNPFSNILYATNNFEEFMVVKEEVDTFNIFNNEALIVDLDGEIFKFSIDNPIHFH